MLTQGKKLTVAIPTYNREDYLCEAIESLNNQTYKNFQVLVFDNASNYPIDKIIPLFPNLDIQIIKNEKNIGGAANFIKMIEFPFGTPYVIMFHDDDTLHPKYFESAIGFLDTHPRVVWVGSNINFVENSRGSEMEKFDSFDTKDSFIELNQQDLIKKIMDGFSLGFGTVVYQSQILKSAKIRNEEFEKWADRPLLIDLALDRTVAITEKKFMNYRMHEKKDSLIREPSNLGYLINLFNYYKETSAESNTYRFKVLQTTNSINTATQITATFKELLNTLGKLEEGGLFSFKYLSPKGVYYFIKFAIRKFL